MQRNKTLETLRVRAGQKTMKTALRVADAVRALIAEDKYPSLRAICAKVQEITGHTIAVTTILRNPDAYAIYRNTAIVRVDQRAKPGYYDKESAGSENEVRRARADLHRRKVKRKLIRELIDQEEAVRRLEKMVDLLQEENLRLQATILAKQ